MSVLLRPRWIAGHLLALITVVGFVNLGMWQLRRHDEKSELRATVEAAQVLAPVPIDAAPSGSYRRVSASGTFDGSLQTKVLRSQGGVSGYHVLTPFLIDDALAVLVDRGWIPLDAAIPAPPDARDIEGTLWPAEAGSSIPDTLGEAVRRIDPEILEAFAGYDLLDEYLLLTAPDPGGANDPRLPDPPQISLGPHLSYAVQWFVFTVVVIAGYPLLLRRVGGAGSRSRRG